MASVPFQGSSVQNQPASGELRAFVVDTAVQQGHDSFFGILQEFDVDRRYLLVVADDNQLDGNVHSAFFSDNVLATIGYTINPIDNNGVFKDFRVFASPTKGSSFVEVVLFP